MNARTCAGRPGAHDQGEVSQFDAGTLGCAAVSDPAAGFDVLGHRSPFVVDCSAGRIAAAAPVSGIEACDCSLALDTRTETTATHLPWLLLTAPTGCD